MTTLFIVVTVLTMTVVVALAGGAFGTVVKPDRVSCPRREMKVDVVVRRRVWPGGHLGRAREIECGSALSSPVCASCAWASLAPDERKG